jgi:hypothetical protein
MTDADSIHPTSIPFKDSVTPWDVFSAVDSGEHPNGL